MIIQQSAVKGYALLPSMIAFSKRKCNRIVLIPGGKREVFLPGSPTGLPGRQGNAVSIAKC